jgi:flagellar biosynthesis/type III secretory pathway protein FliH
MRPFIPPALVAPAQALSEEERALAQAEENGRVRGRQQGDAAGHARGLAEGDAQARAELQPRIDALEAELQRRRTEDSLGDVLRNVLDARMEDRLNSDTALAAALSAALTLIFPALSKAAEGLEAAALVQSVLTEREQDRLRVSAHPDTLARLQPLLATGGVLAGKADRVEMVADPKAETGAAAISWQYGGVYYEPQDLLDRVTRSLRPAHASAPMDIKPDSKAEGEQL